MLVSLQATATCLQSKTMVKKENIYIIFFIDIIKSNPSADLEVLSTEELLNKTINISAYGNLLCLDTPCRSLNQSNFYHSL